MIYNFFRILSNIAIRVYYGKIEVSGIENIPKGVPLLIASNHPNGFLEPIIIGCIFPRPLHFMVRGDVFRMKWLKPFLVRTNQIPIFRFKDGFSELRKNDSSLQVAYKELDKGAAIILFIEGGTLNIKKLRPFQKGLARMASSYVDREGGRKDLHVLPVAINFVSPFVLRSRVFLNIEKPFKAEDYFHDSSQKTAEIRKMTDDLYSLIKPIAFHVSDDERQEALNKTLKFTEGLFSSPFLPIVSYKPKLWNYFKSVSDSIDEMDDTKFINFNKEINEIGEVRIDDVKRSIKWPIINGVLSFLLLVPAFIGLILNIIPGLIAQTLAKKVLDEDNSVFKASIILSSGIGFYAVYYIVIIGTLSIFYGIKSLLFLLAWPLGFVYLLWKSIFQSLFLKRKYQLTKPQKDGIINLFSKYNITLPKTSNL